MFGHHSPEATIFKLQSHLEIQIQFQVSNFFSGYITILVGGDIPTYIQTYGFFLHHGAINGSPPARTPKPHWF